MRDSRRRRNAYHLLRYLKVAVRLLRVEEVTKVLAIQLDVRKCPYYVEDRYLG